MCTQNQYITHSFTEAVQDYQFLLEKSYSNKEVLKLVGDRYHLTKIQQTLLYRGIFITDVCLRRKQKQTIKWRYCLTITQR